MPVFVVTTEWNSGADLDGAFSIDGVYADATSARRAKWATMRRHIRSGFAVYGRRNDTEWTVDVTVHTHDLQ